MIGVAQPFLPRLNKPECLLGAHIVKLIAAFTSGAILYFMNE